MAHRRLGSVVLLLSLLLACGSAAAAPAPAPTAVTEAPQGSSRGSATGSSTTRPVGKQSQKPGGHERAAHKQQQPQEGQPDVLPTDAFDPDTDYYGDEPAAAPPQPPPAHKQPQATAPRAAAAPGAAGGQQRPPAPAPPEVLPTDAFDPDYQQPPSPKSKPAKKQAWGVASVLCRADGRPHACSVADDTRLVQKHWQQLQNLNVDWAVVSTSVDAKKRNTDTFVILTRHLTPSEANIQFAQAFCLSLAGGRLAYWDSQAEYEALAQLVRALARHKGSALQAFVGAVQLPGSPEPKGGWHWLHKPAVALPSGFPWAPGEPNQHNTHEHPGHKEDCAVVASYHPKAVKNLIDDFACGYATPDGKRFQLGGADPKLTVACRIAAGVPRDKRDNKALSQLAQQSKVTVKKVELN